MNKLSHQAKVYNALASAGLGVPVSVESLLAIEGLLPYKLSAYVLYAKIDYGADIAPIRDGRKVVAYQMNGIGNGLPDKSASVTTTKVAVVKAPKAPKVVVPKTPKPPKVVVPKASKAKPPKREITAEMMADDRIVDVLDDLMEDGDIQYSEDRAFARDYVAVMF